MEDQAERAVRRAIISMQENLGDDLTVDDLARAAMFSKFHFTRVFHRVTGVTPGRFLSALRVRQAKYLLLSTSLNVTDISLRVGYHSVSTFSGRFSRAVGLSPTAYRQRAGYAPEIPADLRRWAGPDGGRVRGTVRGGAGRVFIGLSAHRIPEGRPVRCAVLPGPGPFAFGSVPSGTWYLFAQSVTGDPYSTVLPAARGRISVAARGPLTVRPETRVTVGLTLKPAGPLDPPALLALSDARRPG